jgi:hypothetical protein
MPKKNKAALSEIRGRPGPDELQLREKVENSGD